MASYIKLSNFGILILFWGILRAINYLKNGEIQSVANMPIPKQLTKDNRTVNIVLERSARLSKSVRWSVKNDELLLRVPAKMSTAQIEQLLERIKEKVFTQPKSTRPSDSDLDTLARMLNARHFESALQWRSIRWVDTMERRLGSCTVGGATDGDIRISTRLQAWPSYVLEYVVAHEICHRKYADHSPDFWNYLARYPLTERARGFIEGIAYVQDIAVD